MVSYVLLGRPRHLFDPAVGAGVFFKAAKHLRELIAHSPALLGAEIDPETLRQARQNGLTNADLADVRISDFVFQPPNQSFQAIVANPPYIRHHRLSADTKERLKTFCARLMGRTLDGRAGLHVYFLLRALQLLEPQGRLAFIMPADTCEGIFANALWEWVTKRYRLEAVVTFAPEASPFPGVDTNALIFMIRNMIPNEQFWWVRCHEPGTPALRDWVLKGLEPSPQPSLSIHDRRLSEALTTGLSRSPLGDVQSGPVLGDYAKVLRGIATGANEFFLMTLEQIRSMGIPQDFFVRAIGRTRDILGEEVTTHSLEALEKSRRATWLLSLDGRLMESFPQAIRAYLRSGEAQGIHKRALIGMRNPWYKMERRPAPPILFAYLGRRNCRFVRNRAGVVPLTSFLCVYPHQTNDETVEKLIGTLNHPNTIANLALVAKSYGGGALKVEPRALEKLPLPSSVVQEAGLGQPEHIKQLEFNYAS